MKQQVKKIALIGNPNSGKTSVFNQLTGLNQRVGNYPGITVDKKTGLMHHQGKSIEILDLPGTYSLYPKSTDEEIVRSILHDKQHVNHPDLVVVIIDAANLERNLLLFTQLHDMNLPVIMALNMVDVAEKQGIEINVAKLSELFDQVKVIPIIARSGKGIDALKDAIINFEGYSISSPFLAGEFKLNGLNALPTPDKQSEWSELRYKQIHQRLIFCQTKTSKTHIRNKFDKIATHPILGYLLFLGVLFMVFQAIFSWAEWPMDLIDTVFLTMSQWVKNMLPDGVFTNLLAEGIIPGLGGVLIFIPQIALLFGFIFILEETGYMSRVVFMMDRLMRPFGLNGRSVVPLMSGMACAIPAILATRTIDNWKDRFVTIMVTPLMSCSARLPVFTLLIAIVIPDQSIGIFNLKGLTLLGLYLMGLLAALATAAIISSLIKTREKSFLVMEIPLYKMPRWKNMLITIYEKVKVFVWEAGRVIMAISVILWVLASFGPGDRMENAAAAVPVPTDESAAPQYERDVASARLSNSYIGILGGAIEPVIRPLGFNWQIGIALITSFAAREVFVGSMATIYSVGEDFEEDMTLVARMKAEINPSTSKPVYTLASGISLMIFYVFAMQCMSTLAVVLRETKQWKWPLIQLAYMTGLAYLMSLIAFQIFS